MNVTISAAPIVDDVENGSPSGGILAAGNLGLAFHRAQLVAGIMADTYEVVYLLFARASFHAGITDKGASPLGHRHDQGHGCYDDLQYLTRLCCSFVHAAFIVLPAIGMIRIYHSTTSTLGDTQTAGNQPEVPETA
ncbi:hypothetical protein L209DRAFT_745001 [Thermothelomyces heterothallicus CBS 203.75]